MATDEQWARADWDSPVFRVYEYGELLRRKRHNGSIEPGYPGAWTMPSLVASPDADASVVTVPPIKDLIRELAGHRCIRCCHPYRVGQESLWSEPAEPESMQELAALSLFEAEPVDEPRVKRDRPVHYSPCDERCTHGGPFAVRHHHGGPLEQDPSDEATAAARLVAPHPNPALFAAWRILTVHHLDGDKANCRWWNLAALCQRCHLTIQGKVQMDRVWPHEHSEWFRPYVAGFYAWRYEQREITRAEVEERMDELLAYERNPA